ncbi:MAG: hypothetical protein EOP90_10575 [Lysobacteraceae bacterium]|nr:MAG: hypothetical protein EOP90_10575 [Xanthomonadaceae bacterium]
MPCTEVRRGRRSVVRACAALFALAAPSAFAGAGLVLAIEDDVAYARYGQVVDYRVTLSNEGAADAADLAWSLVVSAAMDGEGASWTCYGAGAGATCGGSGNGLPDEVGIALPAGRSLTWVVSVPVRADAADAVADVSAVLAAPAFDASDSNTLVLLRDGFDEAYPLSPAR